MHNSLLMSSALSPWCVCCCWWWLEIRSYFVVCVGLELEVVLPRPELRYAPPHPPVSCFFGADDWTQASWMQNACSITLNVGIRDAGHIFYYSELPYSSCTIVFEQNVLDCVAASLHKVCADLLVPFVTCNHVSILLTWGIYFRSFFAWNSGLWLGS